MRCSWEGEGRIKSYVKSKLLFRIYMQNQRIKKIYKSCRFKEYMKEKIEIDIVIYPEGKGTNKVYSIGSMQIPNVVTQGSTIEEAKERLKEALEIYFESAPWERERLIKIDSGEENNTPMISKLVLVS